MRGSCMVCVPASCVASHVSTRRMADMGEASPSGGKRKKPGVPGRSRRDLSCGPKLTIYCLLLVVYEYVR